MRADVHRTAWGMASRGWSIPAIAKILGIELPKTLEEAHQELAWRLIADAFEARESALIDTHENIIIELSEELKELRTETSQGEQPIESPSERVDER